MRFLLADLKRGLTEKAFWGAVLLGSVCLVISFLIITSNGDVLGADDLFKQTQSMLLPFIAPLIVAIPYANMNMLEKDSGFERLMLLRGRMKHYALRRWLVVGIVSGLTLVIPSVLLAVVCSMTGAYDRSFFMMQIIGLAFLFGFTYGTVAYSLTFYNEKRYIPTLTPQVIYLLFIYAFPYLGLEAYYPPLALSPWLLGGEVLLGDCITQLMILGAMALLGIILNNLMRQFMGLVQRGGMT